MWDAIKGIFRSKKGLTAVAGALSWVVARVGFDVDPGDIYPALLLLSSYVVGQGIADHGKEARKVDYAQPIDMLRAMREAK